MNQVLNKEEFAAAVAKRIDVPPTNTLEFDKENFALVLRGSDGAVILTHNLENFYAHYQDEPEKPEHFIGGISQMASYEVDWTSYDKVSPLLMPAIRDRAMHELYWSELARDHGDAAGALYLTAMCDVFSLFPIVDIGVSQVRIPSRSFDDWAVSLDVVSEQAQKNLLNKTTEFRFSAISDEGTETPSVYQSAWGDDYDAFRALLYDWSILEVKGERLFLLLNPSIVLVWGSQDSFATEYVLGELDIAQDPARAHIRPLPPFALYRRDGAMAIYNPDPVAEPVLYKALKLHQAKYFIQAYERQKNFLESLPEEKSEDLFIASYVALQSKDSQIASVCSWTEGVDSLLPKADFITFIKVDGTGADGSIVGRARWEDAVQILPGQLEQKQYFPYRYETKGFPTVAQLQRLGTCEIF